MAPEIDAIVQPDDAKAAPVLLDEKRKDLSSVR